MDNGASSYHRFLEGDDSAFDEILDFYQDSLIFFINRYVRDISAAEDIAEDTFLELLIHKHRYNFKVSLKTYLFTIGRNKAINYIRHNSVHAPITLDDAENIAHKDESLENRILRMERERALSNAIDKLPCDYRAAIHLVYFEELSYENAAKVMKKNKKQIENLVYRAKNALRTTLGREGFEL